MTSEEGSQLHLSGEAPDLFHRQYNPTSMIDEFDETFFRPCVEICTKRSRFIASVDDNMAPLSPPSIRGGEGT